MTAPKPWEVDQPVKKQVEAPVEEESNEPEYHDERGHYNEPFPEELADMPVKEYGAPEGSCFEDMAYSTYEKQLQERNRRAYRPNEMAFREVFIREFVKDWNQTRAAIRAGVHPNTARAKASALMREHYVLRRLDEYINKIDEEVLLTRKKVIIGLMKEANDFSMGSSHGARVNAWKTLGKYMGMEITRIEGEINHKGNVMVIPSSPTGEVYDAESWEEAASMAQQQLKKVVRD